MQRSLSLEGPTAMFKRTKNLPKSSTTVRSALSPSILSTTASQGRLSEMRRISRSSGSGQYSALVILFISMSSLMGL